MTQLGNPYKEILSRFNSCIWFICYSEAETSPVFQTSGRAGAPQRTSVQHCSCQLGWGKPEHPGFPKGWEQGTAGTCLPPQGTSPLRIKLKPTLLQIKRDQIVTLTEDGGTFSHTLCLKAESIKSVLLSQVLGIPKDGECHSLSFQCLTTLDFFFSWSCIWSGFPIS